ncbi:MAG: DUF559 domain-containing protein [Pseudomonadota bacterium]
MSRNRHVHRARWLRQNQSLPERDAWAVLRRFRHHGFPVKRQVPIAGYTVDFAIHRARLVIEIDGPVHREDAIREADRQRDRDLAARGWRVLRLPADLAHDGDGLWLRMAVELGLSNLL